MAWLGHRVGAHSHVGRARLPSIRGRHFKECGGEARMRGLTGTKACTPACIDAISDGSGSMDGGDVTEGGYFVDGVKVHTAFITASAAVLGIGSSGPEGSFEAMLLTLSSDTL